jgi:hypothetical protein
MKYGAKVENKFRQISSLLPQEGREDRYARLGEGSMFSLKVTIRAILVVNVYVVLEVLMQQV